MVQKPETFDYCVGKVEKKYHGGQEGEVSLLVKFLSVKVPLGRTKMTRAMMA